MFDSHVSRDLTKERAVGLQISGVSAFKAAQVTGP